MIARLEKFITADSRRAVALIVTLLVALILVSVGFAVYASDVDLFAEPYPSEDTMLTLTEDGVKWTMNYNLLFSEDRGGGWNHIRYFWGHEEENGYTAQIGTLMEDLWMNNLLNKINATYENWIGSSSYGDVYEERWLINTDAQGNGWFGANDSVTFKTDSTRDQAILEDTVYTVALAYVTDVQMSGYGEFSYAVHDGKFYSWTSHSLSWDEAWWEI
jgi:hypothetical protein